MPIYCYSDEEGNYAEEIFPLSKDPPETIETKDGKTLSRNRRLETPGGRCQAKNWPMYSDAAGVNPEQIPEATRHARNVGVPTDFTSDGRAIFTSPHHRKRYCEAHGLYDRNGGFNDPQRV